MINQNWVFPNNCRLDFSNSPNLPTPFSWSPNTIGGPPSNAREGCASISDNNGNLLFYTDGISIWDENHIQRYTGLLGNPSSTQSAIIVPDPGNIRQYYIFTTDGGSHPNTPPWNHFNGARVNLDTWMVTELSDILNPMPDIEGFSPVEKITAIQHENCRDFWIITVVQRGSDNTEVPTSVNNAEGTFRVFLVDQTGVTQLPDTPTELMIHELGYMKGSPNGRFLGMANGRNNNILVFPFDNATGAIAVTGVITIPVPDPNPDDNYSQFAYGLEFSPNSELLYFANLSDRDQNQGPGIVWQVDFTRTVEQNDIIELPHRFNTGIGRYEIGAIQLGMDNRIYIAKDGNNSLAYIENTNTLNGATIIDDFNLPDNCTSQLGLPNLLPNPCEIHNCGCTGCNQDTLPQNEELLNRAQAKFFIVPSNNNTDCLESPFPTNCENQALPNQVNLEPCFYFHWGDGTNDQIEEHDTEVFYITVCNNFHDIQFKGFRITRVSLIPDIHPIDKIHIVPDRFICFDCLEPCSCQTREFAIITRANDTAGNYNLEVEYCYEEIVIASSFGSGTAQFPVVITED